MKKSVTSKIGHITVPKDALVQPHELNVATILSWTGDNVEFIPSSHIHTPDIKFKGLLWEIKSPIGSSSRTLENNMRLALKQSNNIIMDLSRIKLPEDKCIGVIKRRAKKLGQIRRIIIVTKTKNVIELF